MKTDHGCVPRLWIAIGLATLSWCAPEELFGQSHADEYLVTTLAVIVPSKEPDECLTGIAVGGDGAIYVANARNGSIYKVVDGKTTLLVDGALANPTKLFIDKQGNLFCSALNNCILYKISPEGSVTTFAGSGRVGHLDGRKTEAWFDKPGGLVMDSAGNMFVADNDNHVIRQISVKGDVTTLAGIPRTVGGIDGPAHAATFCIPIDITMDAMGNFYVADLHSQRIRKISTTGIVSGVAGVFEFMGQTVVGTRGHTDGPGHIATFDGPVALTADAQGNLYVADLGNRAIRKITEDGTVSTVAGNKHLPGVYRDGTTREASFYSPRDIALDTAGNIYVADGTTVRKITPLKRTPQAR